MRDPKGYEQVAVRAMGYLYQEVKRPWATEVKLRAERRTGELPAEMQKANGARDRGRISIRRWLAQTGRPPH